MRDNVVDTTKLFTFNSTKRLPRRQLRETEIIHPPRTFWKTFAIISLTTLLIATFVGYEYFLRDMWYSIDHLQDLQIHYGPIFHGAMKKEVLELGPRIAYDLSLSCVLLTLAALLIWYDCVLITRRIIIHVTRFPIPSIQL